MSEDKIITNYKNVNIPEDYTMLKMVSYNISLENSISMRSNINKIVRYIFSNINNKVNDIICLQGINDKYAIYELILSIKKVALAKKIKLYFAPEYEDIQIATVNLSSSFQLAWSNTRPVSKVLQLETSNVIISRYEIINYLHETLDNNASYYNSHVIVANININNSIIAIYNICLCNDIISANINNENMRKNEIMKLNEIIINNSDMLKTDKMFKKYENKDISFIVGKFGIAETQHNSISQEYLDMTGNLRGVDIYRCKNNDEKGYTNKSKKRNNYILLLLSTDIFDEKSKHRKLFMSIKTPEDMLRLLFKRYNIHCFYSDVNTNVNNRNDYPLEIIFIM
jgi:hypothetical protein